MARNARRNYVRDGKGRFASTPGGGPARKAKPARTSFRQRQAVSLARQRKQTGRLGSATREAKAKLQASRRKLATNASPQQKAAVTRAARMAAALAGQRRIQAGPQAGVIRGAAARGVKKALKGRPQPVNATPMGGRVPASQRPGSITSTLRGTLQALAKADAARIREIEGITGQPVRAPRKPAAGTGATVRAPGRRSVSGTLGDNLRSLAQSDARTAREMADLARPTPKGALKGKGSGTSRKRVKGGEEAPKALPAAKVFSKVSFSQAAQKMRQIRASTAPGMRAAFATQRGKRPTALESKKIAKAKQTAERARNWYNTSSRDRPAPVKPKPTRPASKVAAPGSRRKVRGPKMAGTIAKPKGLKPGALKERAVKAKEKSSRLGRSAGPLSSDGARRRGETTKNRSDVSGTVADIKGLGLPIYKPKTARSQGQPGVRVRKGPQPGTVGVIAHTPQAFDKAIALVKKQGAQIIYENRQGQAFTFRNRRKP